MKIKMILLILAFIIFGYRQDVYCDDVLDIYNWNFTMLTEGSDQDSKVVVSKYFNVEQRDKYAFCLEPDKRFLQISGNYEISSYDNSKIFEIVKAYDAIGKEDDNYYIAAQLMIWEENTGNSYTFDGNNYSEYMNNISEQIELQKCKNKTKEHTLYRNDTYTIEGDFTDYDFSNNVNIIENTKEGITFSLRDNNLDSITIELIPKDTESENMYSFISENAQDLYLYYGDYNDLHPFDIKVNFKNKFIDINYSKVDINNKPIDGAEFTLYKIDPSKDSYITFIQNDADVNIYEALLEDSSIYSNLKIETSERYQKYINNKIIHTKEIGYFDYKIEENNQEIASGRVYVSNNSKLTNNSYNRMNCEAILSVLSSNSLINSINNIDSENDYYLCESEPAKGYTYGSEPCILINGNNYKGETFKFINKERTYTLKLMKKSESDILLNGAKFSLTYKDNNEEKTIFFTTGSMYVVNNHDKKYFIYKDLNGNNQINEVNGKDYSNDYIRPGKYLYYFSDDNVIDEGQFLKSIDVIKGGFNIKDLPYSSSLRIEELKPPQGYIITEPVYYVEPDIKYSEITFENYRINTLDILPPIYVPPKTCVNE